MRADGSLYIPNSREGEESAQRKSAQKICKIFRRWSVTIPLMWSLGGYGNNSEKTRPLLILMGKKRPKHFKEKSFTQEPQRDRDARQDLQPFHHLSRPRIPIKENPALHHEKLVQKVCVRLYSDLDSEA